MIKATLSVVVVAWLAGTVFLPPQGGPIPGRPDIYVMIKDGEIRIPPGGVADFGATWVGGPEKGIVFVIRNRGDAPFKIDKIAISENNAFKRRSCEPYSIRVINKPEIQGFTFKVAFAPDQPGEQRGMLRIHSNDPRNNPYTFFLKGAAWQVEYLVLSGDGSRVIPCGKNRPMVEAGTDFGRIRVGEEAVRTFLITNSRKNPWREPTVRIVGQSEENFEYIAGMRRIIKGDIIKPFPGDFRLRRDIYFKPKSPGVHRARVRVRLHTDSDYPSVCEFTIQGEAFE